MSPGTFLHGMILSFAELPYATHNPVSIRFDIHTIDRPITVSYWYRTCIDRLDRLLQNRRNGLVSTVLATMRFGLRVCIFYHGVDPAMGFLVPWIACSRYRTLPLSSMLYSSCVRIFVCSHYRNLRPLFASRTASLSVWIWIYSVGHSYYIETSR